MIYGKDVLKIIEAYCNPVSCCYDNKCFCKSKKFYYENPSTLGYIPKYACSQHVLGFRKRKYIKWTKKLFIRLDDVVFENNKFTIILHKDKRYSYHLPANEFLGNHINLHKQSDAANTNNATQPITNSNIDSVI